MDSTCDSRSLPAGRRAPRRGPDAMWRGAIARRGGLLLRILGSIALLWGFAELGTLLTGLAGLPIPGSVVGMLLLWAALEARVIRLGWIDDGVGLLLGALGLLFVPAGAGFVQFIGAGSLWLEVGAIVVGGSLLSLGLSAKIVQRAVSERD